MWPEDVDLASAQRRFDIGQNLLIPHQIRHRLMSGTRQNRISVPTWFQGQFHSTPMPRSLTLIWHQYFIELSSAWYQDDVGRLTSNQPWTTKQWCIQDGRIQPDLVPQFIEQDEVPILRLMYGILGWCATTNTTLSCCVLAFGSLP
jgi:hypothetical protein